MGVGGICWSSSVSSVSLAGGPLVFDSQLFVLVRGRSYKLGAYLQGESHADLLPYHVHGVVVFGWRAFEKMDLSSLCAMEAIH